MKLTLIAAVVFLACASVAGQTSVTLKGTVSETVALSVAPTFTDGNMEVVSSGNTVRVTLSDTDTRARIIRVPLLVRSNSNFKISATFESQTAELDQLSVTGVQASGSLVSPQVVNAFKIRHEAETDTSRPLLELSGPRISLGGTLNTPSNALKVTLLIRLKPQQSVSGWKAQLTLVGTAGSLVQ
jgi:hypothetical protein